MRRSKRPRSASLRGGAAAPAAAGDATAETAATNSAGTTHQAAPEHTEAPAAPTTPSVPASVAGGSALQDLRGMIQEIVQENIGRLITEGRQGMSGAADTVGTGDPWDTGVGAGRALCTYDRISLPGYRQQPGAGSRRQY